MDIIIKKPKIWTRGFVDLAVYDKEDLNKMEPKHTQQGDNTIDNELLAKLILFLRGSTNNSFKINTASNWFNNPYAVANGGNTSNTTTDRNNQDGIVAQGTVSTGGIVDNQTGEGGHLAVNHFFINDASQSGGGTSVSTDTCTWTVQATWDDPNGSSSNTISKLYMGRAYNVQSSDNANEDSIPLFDTSYAEFDPSNFTLVESDVLKVSWSIQIGG
tara:strand:- start:5033 stop:5680 length:648 start_codon:yes stop_codon:yes gene_type:complete